ncbi:ATP-binding protein [Sulfurospirillum sp.]|nr:ATP-binding protein [Sulfurospirillum sp.]
MEYYIKKEIEAVKIVSFDLKKSIFYCTQKYNDLIIQDDKKISITIGVQSTLILTDKNGFEIVIDNLISNAIKHNKKITHIHISLEDDILNISDDGEGIKSQNIYQVFDKYYQSDNEVKGFGIGLNIVKEFCDKHKIYIKINSSTNGTIFSLNLQNIIDKEL